MDFKEILSKLIEKTPGGLGAALVAKDGLIVESWTKEGFAVDEIAVHITQPLMKSENSVKNARIGIFEEMLLFTDKFSLILKNITDEYFLMTVIDRSCGIYGKGRYEADKTIKKLRPELV